MIAALPLVAGALFLTLAALLWIGAERVSATARCAADYDRCVIALVED